MDVEISDAGAKGGIDLLRYACALAVHTRQDVIEFCLNEHEDIECPARVVVALGDRAVTAITAAVDLYNAATGQKRVETEGEAS